MAGLHIPTHPPSVGSLCLRLLDPDMALTLLAKVSGPRPYLGQTVWNRRKTAGGHDSDPSLGLSLPGMSGRLAEQQVEPSEGTEASLTLIWPLASVGQEGHWLGCW